MKVEKNEICPVARTLSMVGDKWKWLIIRDLTRYPVLRFGELQRSIGGISKRVLALKLKELEADKMVHREAYAEVPLRVEYSLTEVGKSIEPVIQAMYDWGSYYENLK